MTREVTDQSGSLNSFFSNSTGRWDTKTTLYGPDGKLIDLVVRLKCFNTHLSPRIMSIEPEENSPSPQITYPYVRTTLPGSSLAFITPNGSSAIYLIGTVNYDHTTYGVQVDAQAPWKGNASSSWGDFDQVLGVFALRGGHPSRGQCAG